MLLVDDHVVTIANLEAGIELWWTEKTNWPRDFHNKFYQELYGLRAVGLDNVWWSAIVDHLARWRAIRPRTKKEIYDLGQEKLVDLQKEYDELSQMGSKNNSADLYNAGWHEVHPLYQIAFAIKGVNSPVFASKLCHFIIPELFPVIDQEVVGVNTKTYEIYWCFCKKEWEQCQEKANLIERLSASIGVTPIQNYPFSTKIVELCISGWKRTSRANKRKSERVY